MKKFFIFGFIFLILFSSGFLAGNAYRDYFLRNKAIDCEFKESENIISEEEKNQILTILNEKEIASESEELKIKTEEDVGAKKFVGSLKSNKFYPADCSYAKRVKEENKIWFISIEEGEKAGRIFVDCQK